MTNPEQAAQMQSQQIQMVQMLKTIVPDGVQGLDDLETAWRSKLAAVVPVQNRAIALVSPNTPTKLAQVIACAAQQNWQIIPCGAGSKIDWGGVVGSAPNLSPLVFLSTQRLNRLIDHAVGDLTVTVEAGMRFAEVQAILAKAGQFLAIDPLYANQATIGGIVATGDTGSLRQRYHSVRDMLLGISFVRADGQPAKAGGRVVKNVAGYDLMKLLTGSYGTLGILSQLTFRVYPLPEASQTLIVTGDATAIAQATQTLLSSALTPTHVDLLSGTLMETLQLGSQIGLGVCFQSIAASVAEQGNHLSQIAQTLNLSCLSYADEAALWQHLPTQFASSTPNQQIFCKIGIRPNTAIALLQFIESLALPAMVQIHANSGLGRLSCPATIPLEALLKIRHFCETHQGFLSILEAPLEWKQQVDVWGYEGNAIATMRSIKSQFDLHNLLSLGRFVGGI
jgi:glycolate oxidase FAD binding subunit